MSSSFKSKLLRTDPGLRGRHQHYRPHRHHYLYQPPPQHFNRPISPGSTGLKKVTSDMQTHKNPELRGQGGPVKTGSAKPAAAPKPAAPAAKKPPKTELQMKKWVVEYHEGNKNIVIDNTNIKQVVYIFKCINSTIQVKGKVNNIVMDNCKKVALVFDSVVSSVESINCQSLQVQANGKVPTVSIEKTDGFQVYLSKESINAEIVSAKSSEMNVLVPKENGEFAEFALPEQFKSVYNGKSFNTTMTEST